MEHYKRKSRETVNTFVRTEIKFDECSAALDKVLAGLAPWIRQECPIAGRISVMREVERRNMSQSQRMAAKALAC